MTATTATTAPPRLHGLDALRAAALGLGIVLHSLIPFAPGALWLVTDSVTSDAVNVPLVLIHLFRMVLFMMLAGYFGRMVLHRRGTGAYLRDRALRILLPLVAFWPVAVLSLGILVGVNVALRGVEPPPTPAADASPLLAFTPGQLWFLLVLMECVLITVVVRAVARRLAGPDRVARLSGRAGALLASPWGVGLAAVPYLVGLLVQGHTAGGIVEPFTVLPEVAPLVTYLGAFGVGWFLQARPDALTRLAATWPVHLGAAVVLSAVVLLGAAALPLWAAAAITALAGWTWTYGLVGVCSRYLTRERPVVRYLADASYWMYLLHLPLLVGIEILLADLAWPIPVKLVLTWAVTAVVLLLGYDLLVRGTWLGAWLNGRRRPRALRRRRTVAAG
ncbi:acyltransferase family protein [Pseudonocardia petroleophila]|uniref:Acyltransferase family protein n=1 Tax=Pseudonocardia petroleophila TaxID=37331 RepID=A0A7G7MH70_9PSEU|nr:acyltransferase family protein [Pseudonocardia petroleophila]QNG52131.1 acyltransferase family protein [Pseudonocardia petroleophila]